MSIVNAEHHVVTSLSEVKEQRLDTQLRQLEFHALLHRKLDLTLLLEGFMSEAQAFLKFDGLQFLAGTRGCDTLIGDVRQYRQQFELKLGEHTLGDVILMRGKAYSAREKRDAERLVESLIYPLENALEHYVVVQRSLTDRVSGVHNQLAIEQQLPREIRLSRRGEQPMSIMLLSVDYLESISEHHGTEAGELAWQAVADALSTRLRQSDIIFRTELDEFLVILNHTELGGAMALSERLRQQVDRAVSFDNVQFVLTASAGVTELGETDNAEQLLGRARQALAKARLKGRNQVLGLEADSPTAGSTPPSGGTLA